MNVHNESDVHRFIRSTSQHSVPERREEERVEMGGLSLPS
jgi:hypothetical protein